MPLNRTGKRVKKERTFGRCLASSANSLKVENVLTDAIENGSSIHDIKRVKGLSAGGIAGKAT